MDYYEILEYMEGWINQEGWDDYQIIAREAEAGNDEALEHMAYLLDSNGAIDSKHCYPEYQKVEKEIEKLARKHKRRSQKEQDRIHKEIFEGIITFECSKCNHVSFLTEDDLDLYPELNKKCSECSCKKIQKGIMYSETQAVQYLKELKETYETNSKPTSKSNKGMVKSS